MYNRHRSFFGSETCDTSKLRKRWMVGRWMEPTRASVLSSNFFLLFQIIINQKEPDHLSFFINIKSKGTFSSKKEPIGKVWYIAHQSLFISCLCFLRAWYFVKSNFLLTKKTLSPHSLFLLGISSRKGKVCSFLRWAISYETFIFLVNFPFSFRVEWRAIVD